MTRIIFNFDIKVKYSKSIKQTNLNASKIIPCIARDDNTNFIIKQENKKYILFVYKLYFYIMHYKNRSAI